jgi:anti-anti-sigma factor
MSMQVPEFETYAGPLPGSASLLIFGERRTLVLSGEFDAGTSDGLVTALELACAGEGDLVVDMSGVAFVDSFALRQIERAALVLAAQGRTLQIAHPPRIITRLLHVAGATDLLHP